MAGTYSSQITGITGRLAPGDVRHQTSKMEGKRSKLDSRDAGLSATSCGFESYKNMKNAPRGYCLTFSTFTGGLLCSITWLDLAEPV
jgi:hypothetical protein